YSPAMQLTDPGQVEVAGNQYVSRDPVVALFSPDRNRSLLRVPLEARRAQIERIPWVETARVLRVFPDRIRVEITERRPVVFLRTGSELALMDAQGVILERPTQGDFRLPVVSGLGEAVPLAERAGRMRMFQQFLTEIEGVRAGSSDLLSEADLSSAEDLRAMLVPPAGGAQAVLVHFGSSEFGPRFRLLLDNFAQWQAQAGHIASIDLRFKKQVVVNREP